MYEIIKKINSNRFVTVKGIPGVGKKGIVSKIALFLEERSIFKNGIIQIEMRANYNASLLISKLLDITNSQLGVEDDCLNP